MPEVAIYCRLSIEDRDKVGDDVSESIQNQKAMLRDYCRERDWAVYDIYVDAFTTDRIQTNKRSTAEKYAI